MATLVPGAVSLTSASSTSIVLAGAVTTGGSGTYTYQWYRATGGLGESYVALSGKTTAASCSDTTVVAGSVYSYVLVGTDTGTSTNGISSSAVIGPVLAYTAQNVGTNSYMASVSGFTPVAAPTDILNIFGSASKLVTVNRIKVTGITSAATAITLDCRLIKRSTAGTLGSAVLTALTATPLDSSNPAGSAVVSTVGTANYTTLGTIVGEVASEKLALTLSPATATDFPQSNVGAVFTFNDGVTQNVTLRGVAEQLAINLNAPTLPAGTVLNIFVEWTEK